MSPLSFALETLAAAAAAFAFLGGTVKMTGPKYAGKKQTALLLLAVLAETGIEVWIDRRSLYSISDFSLWIVLLHALFALCTALLLGRGPLWRRASAAAASVLAVSAVDCLAFCVTGTVWGNTLSSYNHFTVIMQPSSVRRCYLAVSSALILLLYFALGRVLERARLLELRHWCALLAGVLPVFAASWRLMWVSLRQYWLTSGYLLSLLGIITLSVFLWAFARYRKERRMNKLLHDSNAMMTENYRRLHEEQLRRAKELHDFNHHISTLRGLSLEGKSDQAAAYADRLLQASYREKGLCRSGNDVVDAVINRKAAEAESAQIGFAYSVEFPVPESIDPVDVCAILANQLDNALEACREIEDPAGRSVEVHIWRQTGNIVFFQVVNTAKENPFTPDGRLVSRKRDGARPHGLGLKSIGGTARKYQGDLKNTWEDGKFISTVFLCVDEE